VAADCLAADLSAGGVSRRAPARVKRPITGRAQRKQSVRGGRKARARSILPEGATGRSGRNACWNWATATLNRRWEVAKESADAGDTRHLRGRRAPRIGRNDDSRKYGFVLSHGI